MLELQEPKSFMNEIKSNIENALCNSLVKLNNEEEKFVKLTNEEEKFLLPCYIDNISNFDNMYPLTVSDIINLNTSELNLLPEVPGGGGGTVWWQVENRDGSKIIAFTEKHIDIKSTEELILKFTPTFISLQKNLRKKQSDLNSFIELIQESSILVFDKGFNYKLTKFNNIDFF